MEKPQQQSQSSYEDVAYLKKQIEFILGVTKTGLDIIDSKMNIRYIDAEWQKIYGDPSGKKCYEYFMGRSSICENCGIPKALVTRQPVTTEEVLVNENNRIVQVTSIPFQDSNGDWLVAEVNVDITQRRKIEDDLRRSEKKYRQLIEMVHEGLLIFDSSNSIIFVNSGLCEILQYSSNELISRDLSFLFDSRQINQLIDTANQNLRKLFTYEVKRKDDIVVSILISASVLPHETHDSRATLLFMTDISDQRRLEQEIQRADKLESIGVLAGGIAHDFNNILTAVVGNISLAKMFLNAKDYDNGLERLLLAEKAVLQSKDLTRQLLTFSKGGAPVLKLGSVRELLQDSSEFALRGSNVRCEITMNHDLWFVEMDEGQISQVMQNLVINAVQAMAQGGTIKISAENYIAHPNQPYQLTPGKYVKISVEDQGTGIPKENISRIFDLYFTTKPRGSGLGLATCHSIITKHNGRIVVQSEEGKGSVFSFFLPAKDGNIEAFAPSGEDLLLGEGIVIFMDDDEFVREYLTAGLKNLGYDPMAASDGLELIELFQKVKSSDQKIHSVILDLTIPGGMGGCDTLQRLKQIDPDVNAIVSSGYSNDPILSGYCEFGFKAAISKPYQIKQLSEILYQFSKTPS